MLIWSINIEIMYRAKVLSYFYLRHSILIVGLHFFPGLNHKHDQKISDITKHYAAQSICIRAFPKLCS